MSRKRIKWNERGSEWHRWDPHIHAPGTLRNDQFGGDWTAYLKTIEEASPAIRALGITDYCSIQSYRKVREHKDKGRLPHVDLLFPNVEVRLDVKTAKAKGINLHLLFSPETLNHEEEIERILGEFCFEFRERTWRCTQSDLSALGKLCEPKHQEFAAALSEGVNQFKVSFQQLRELFRREAWLRENCLICIAAAQGDGMAGLQGDDAFMALREEMQRFAHIIMSGKPSDRDFWLGRKDGFDRASIEETYGGLKPCIQGCDAHTLEQVGKPHLGRYCWIKGDFAFESLRQAVIEPDERVWIGEHPPLAPADSVVIDAVHPMKTPWLKNDKIVLNRGLTAIIGARGSGKTALIDLIAAGANALTYPLAESSFLLRASEPEDLLGDAKVEEFWKDGTKYLADFRPPDEFPLEEPVPAVCYLSQQFVDRLCSSGGLANELRREIERVIFEQIDPTDRYETDSFESLAGVLLNPIRYRRDQHIDEVTAISEKTAEEQRLREKLPRLRTDRVTAQTNLGKQRKELEDLIPKGKELRAKRLVELETACTASEGTIERLRRRTKTLDDLLADANHVRLQIEPQRFENLKRRFSEADLATEEWESFRQTFSGDVVAITAKAKQEAEKTIRLIHEANPAKPFDPASTPLANWPLALLRKERDQVKKEVGIDTERQRKYDVIKRAIGSSELALKNLDAQINLADGADERRKTLLNERRVAYRTVFDTFVEEENVLIQLYGPLQNHLSAATGSLGKLRFSVRRVVRFSQWVAAGEALLDLRKDTRFRGHGALAREGGKSLLHAWRSGTAETVATAMHEFVSDISGDIRSAMPSSVTSEEKSDWMREVGDWLYDSSHIKIEYGLEYDGIAVEQLSPGTRGIVLLLLFLAIDRSDRRPLLIDQPEENLDPKSVFHDLVPHFREARKRRQVIIVTHNANLVVNTDADQVIVASSTPPPDGGLPAITYESGSLENPKIRHAVCDILEGGKRAFLERERRYRLQSEQMMCTESAFANPE